MLISPRIFLGITDWQLHSQDELFDIIRRTHLAGDPNIHPFEQSELSIQTVSFCVLFPTQAFVFQEQINMIDEIHNQMLKHGIDTTKMRGFLSYHIDSSKESFVFTPPIVEVIDNQQLIIDGQHRTVYAHDKNITFNALFIENIDESVYPYQLPLTGGWDSVKRFQDKLPDGFVRKERRYPNGKHLYYFREYPFPGIIKLEREHTGR